MVTPAQVTAHEAERAIVGATLRDADGTLRAALEHTSPEDFQDKRLASVWAVMIERWTEKEPVTDSEILIAKACAEKGVRGVNPVALFDLKAQVHTTSNAGYLAKIVHETSVRSRMRQAGLRIMQLADATDPLGEVMAHAREEFDAVRASNGAGITAKSLGEVLAGSDEYDWLIPNLLERQDRVIVTGAEGAGKSTLVRQIGVMAAAGLHPTLTTSIRPIRVLVVDAENTEKQWRRAVRTLTLKARMAGTARPEDMLELSCTPRIDITSDRDLGSIHRLCDEHEPDLLMIGPIYKLVPRAINNDDDAAPVIAALDTLRDRGLAMVMEAHAGHAVAADGNRNLRPRGSAALLGWPEFGFGIAADPTEKLEQGDRPSRFQLVRWRGDRDERAWPVKLRRGPDWPWQDDNPTATLAAINRIEAKRSA